MFSERSNKIMCDFRKVKVHARDACSHIFSQVWSLCGAMLSLRDDAGDEWIEHVVEGVIPRNDGANYSNLRVCVCMCGYSRHACVVLMCPVYA